MPILLLCLVFWLFWLCLSGIRLIRYKRADCLPLFTEAEAREKQLILRTQEGGECAFFLREVRHYRMKGGRLCLFLKDFRYLQGECSGEQIRFLALKLSVLPFWRRTRCIPALLLALVITLTGAAGVYESARPYGGKLARYLQDLGQVRTAVLKRDNLYTDGLDGVMEAVIQAVGTQTGLPVALCLESGFNLHFEPDGTITELSVFLSGYDEKGNFVDTYLIDYHAARSNRLTVRLHGAAKGVYREEKDFGLLRDALRVIPVPKTVSGWKEPIFGILYRGVRTWQEWDTNVVYISDAGEIMETEGGTGYSISVFCPEDEEQAPVRYLYIPGQEGVELVRGGADPHIRPEEAMKPQTGGRGDLQLSAGILLSAGGPGRG